MKTYILILLTFLIVYNCSASPNKHIEISAPISSIKVSLNAAEITHSVNLKLNNGINKFAFLGLASNIFINHISFLNIGKSELISYEVIKINDSTNIQLLSPEAKEIIGKSNDSIKFLEKLILKNKLEIEALNREKEMLLKNEMIVSNTRQISVSELKFATDFYRERLKDIGLELFNKTDDLNDLKKKKVKMLKSIFRTESAKEIDLQFTVILAEIFNPNTAFVSDIQLIYFAEHSGWIPVYEIYYNGDNKIKINYRAKILNNTGTDWKNQKITITSADPFEFYSAPDLQPLYINKSNMNSYYTKNQNNNLIEQTDSKNQEEILIPDKEIEFKILKPYTFKTGTNPTYIDVTEYEVTGNILYRCTPKKDEQAYSIAQIKDWEKFNLLDGEASIFNNSNFLGKMYIKPSEFEDNFEIPLGVMDKIYVNHKLVGEFSSKKALLGNIVETQSYEIKLKNIGVEKVLIELIDQLPISNQKSKKSEIIDISEGFEQDETNGKLIWKIDLNGNSEKLIKLKYSVTYPKGRGFGLNHSYSKTKSRAIF